MFAAGSPDNWMVVYDLTLGEGDAPVGLPLALALAPALALALAPALAPAPALGEGVAPVGPPLLDLRGLGVRGLGSRVSGLGFRN